MRLELVERPVSANTIEALQEILEDAKAGIYVGFVIGLVRPRRRFTVHCVGEACETPSWSRSICLSIDDHLRDMIASDDKDTTF